jgi:hypothetical protein
MGKYIWLMPLVAGLLNFLMTLRSLRSLRWNAEMRKVIWAYERELRERGITDLPPRCVCCCQILPRHVRGCDLGKLYEYFQGVTEVITRPPIKYFPKGQKPPDLGRGKSA